MPHGRTGGLIEVGTARADSEDGIVTGPLGGFVGGEVGALVGEH